MILIFEKSKEGNLLSYLLIKHNMLGIILSLDISKSLSSEIADDNSFKNGSSSILNLFPIEDGVSSPLKSF